MVGRGGFEPPTPGSSVSLNELFRAYKSEFKEWLSVSRKISEKTRRDYVNALERFFTKYEITKWNDLKRFIDAEDRKRNIVNGMRVFLTFLAERDVLDYDVAMLVKKRFIKGKPIGVRKVAVDEEKIKQSYELVKHNKIKALLYELLVFTGLRYSNIIEMLRTYEPSKLVKVNENVARYPLFIGGHKGAFWAYMPLGLAEKLERHDLNYNTAKAWFFRVPAQPNAVRKWFTTFLARHGVSAEIIDFIQGRAPRTVLERHYLNLTVLADESYSKVVDDLKKVLEDD